MREKHIEPHIPVWDKTAINQGIFTVAEFHWNPEEKAYDCPAGHKLQAGLRYAHKKEPTITKENTVIYRSKKTACDSCDLKTRCCPNTGNRKIARSIFEESREVARKITASEIYDKTFKQRKKVEVLFAHLKRDINLRRLRLRGLKGANDEFVLAATVQNLKKLAQRCIKPPDKAQILAT